MVATSLTAIDGWHGPYHCRIRFDTDGLLGILQMKTLQNSSDASQRILHRIEFVFCTRRPSIPQRFAPDGV